MNYLATITSKRQLTIPVELYKLMAFQEGQKVIISKMDEGIRVESALSLVGRLAGSVEIPNKFKNLTLEKMIIKAKKEYFKNKNK